VVVKLMQRFRMEYQGEDVGIKSGLVGGPDREIVLSLRGR